MKKIPFIVFIIFIFSILSCGKKVTDHDQPDPSNPSRDAIKEICKVENIKSPPDSLNLDPFYKKYLDADGIPIISSNKVPDKALCIAGEIVLHMLLKRPDIKYFMTANKTRVGIMAVSEVTTDIPEHRYLANDPNTNWDTRARGLGASPELPITTCAEENLLYYTNDRYRGENILVHEFAHSIHLMGLMLMDYEFNERLYINYKQALENGLWRNTYAGSNMLEYWAEGVQDWFNCNLQASPTDGVHNFVNTRWELKEYDFME